MNRLFLIGNGFIKHTRNLIINESKESDLIDQYNLIHRVASTLNDVSNLFNEITELGDSLRIVLNCKIDNETIFEIADNIIALYRIQLGEYYPIECYNILAEKGQSILERSILPVVRKFEKIERDGIYGDFLRLISQYQIGDNIKSHYDQCDGNISIFTTNYDGFLEQTLCASSGVNGWGFYFKDGFGGFGIYDLTHHEPNFKTKYFLGHIHSSYRYGWHDGKWIKTRLRERKQLNNFPTLVYSMPKEKMNYIYNNPLLLRYWLEFERRLDQCNEIIIFGNSLRSDPHIKIAIKNTFGKFKKYYVIKNNCDDLSSAEKSFYGEENVVIINANNINLTNYHVLFTEPNKLIQ
jgi:hypothetical protein